MPKFWFPLQSSPFGKAGLGLSVGTLMPGLLCPVLFGEDSWMVRDTSAGRLSEEGDAMSDGNTAMRLGRSIRDRAIYEASKLEGVSNADLGELFGMTSERARQIVKREAQTKPKAKRSRS